ncbi:MULTISPECIES: pilus assembly protein TadG-related protein [unclassified Dietzia]|uniref:pilus assembly protein TadG-related protein n=1 Tax=unclassified Dietzia TaxID=2617939 RepID=UPI0015FADB71|nr:MULTISPECIES: pilus assembly protein TadG-related protein [unclassified Dietzia]MBB1024486.1 hypothetical protein [Dietzia sp. DQ12-76]MBB1028570.1 hypothetical protein [Dietzia sp. DQ11-38-2]
MQRLNDDRGAVSVMVALLMIPLIGFAAISIDIASVHSERQQLQTGADAAALAIAQDCARGNCRTPRDTAQQFLTANTIDAEATAGVVPVPTPSSGRVSVTGSGIREHWFAPVLGINETAIAATATTGWGAPTGGRAVLPLTFSLCDFRAQTGGGMPSGTVRRTIYASKTAGANGCTGPSGNHVPGGFGWLAANSGRCSVANRINEVLWSDPGNSVPNACTDADLIALRNATVLIPVFDESGDSGSNAWYRVYGYAAFRITGYRFSGREWNSSCRGNERCIEGYFTRFVDLSDDFDYGPTAPDMGASVVALLPR